MKIEIDLDAILREDFGALALQIRDQVAWWGAQLDSPLTVSQVIASVSRELTDEEKAEALKFYDGDQWPEEVAAVREGRPCCVVNRLPELVAAAIAKEFGSFMPGEVLPAQVAADIETLKIVITRQNRDAQMLYNYLISAYVEIISNRFKQPND
jgi:hypothetical protein